LIPVFQQKCVFSLLADVGRKQATGERLKPLQEEDVAENQDSNSGKAVSNL